MVNPLLSKKAVQKMKNLKLNKAWRAKNPNYYKIRNERARVECILAYGKICVFCGETDMGKLQVHFSWGNRHLHKGKSGSIINTGKETWFYLKKNNYPRNWGIKIGCKTCIDTIHAKARKKSKTKNTP